MSPCVLFVLLCGDRRYAFEMTPEIDTNRNLKLRASASVYFSREKVGKREAGHTKSL